MQCRGDDNNLNFKIMFYLTFRDSEPRISVASPSLQLFNDCFDSMQFHCTRLQRPKIFAEFRQNRRSLWKGFQRNKSDWLIVVKKMCEQISDNIWHPLEVTRSRIAFDWKTLLSVKLTFFALFRSALLRKGSRVGTLIILKSTWGWKSQNLSFILQLWEWQWFRNWQCQLYP